MREKIFWADTENHDTTSKSVNTLYAQSSSWKRWLQNHEWITRSMCANCITMSVSCSTRTTRLSLNRQNVNKSYHKVEQRVCQKAGKTVQQHSVYTKLQTMLPRRRLSEWVQTGRTSKQAFLLIWPTPNLRQVECCAYWVNTPHICLLLMGMKKSAAVWQRISEAVVIVIDTISE